MVAAPVSTGSPRARVAATAVLVLALSLTGWPAPASAQLVGSISGVVTADGAPVANVWVEATPVTPTGGWAGRGFVTATDARGRYRFPDVYHPHVKVLARAPALSGLATTYWPAAYTFATAEVLGVASSGTTADIELAAGGKVSGTVVGSGAPVAGARVTAYPADSDRSEPVGTARLAGGPGQFAIEGLPPVPVVLFAEASPTGNLLGAWYDGAAYAGAATPVDGGTETAGLRIALSEGGEIGGTVRDDSGAPVSGARVSLTHCPGLCPLVATTDEQGGYRIGSVPPGRGLMLHATADDQGLLPDWRRTPGGSAEERMDLAAGEVLAGRDLVLVRGAFLAAAIVDDSTGAPVAGISAELVSRTDPLLSFLPAMRDRLVVRSGDSFLTPDDPPDPAMAPADAPDGPATGTGQFLIGPVPPGEYRLAVYPGYRNPRYLPVTWGHPTGIDGTGTVRLTAGERVDVVVPLVASSTAAAAPAAAAAPQAPPVLGAPAAPWSGPSGADSWPGLDAGFLARAGASWTRSGTSG